MKKAHLSVHFQKLLYQLYLSWSILVVRVPVSHCKRTYPIRYLEDFTVLILDKKKRSFLCLVCSASISSVINSQGSTPDLKCNLIASCKLICKPSLFLYSQLFSTEVHRTFLMPDESKRPTKGQRGKSYHL